MSTSRTRRRAGAPLPRGPLGLALGLLLTALVLGACGSGAAPAPRSATALVNFQLGPEYSHWLVGPVARMATPQEVQAYLGLTDDFAAVDFMEGFWARRDPDPEERGNPVRRAFEERAADADRMYSEAGILGRRTARGTILVLYGEPAAVEYEIAPEGGEPIIVWRYSSDTPPGLDGRSPDRFYWFRKVGELTGFYQRGPQRPVRPINP